MKVLLTGTSGLFGAALAQWLLENRPDWEFVFTSRREPLATLKKHWRPLDLVDQKATYDLITKANPDIVLHLAAFSRPDPCELNPEEAFRSNFLATRNVALACDRFDTELLYTSTDQAFYGAHPELAHGEYDEPKPISVYGRTKVLGENYIRAHLRRYYLLRTAKIFGGPNDDRSIVHKLFTSFRQNEPFDVATDWRAHTTHADHLSEALVRLIERKIYGIYHVASPEIPSYLEISHELLNQMKKPLALARPISAAKLKLPAVRTSRTELSTQIWEADFGNPLPSWKEGLGLFLKERSYKAVSL